MTRYTRRCIIFRRFCSIHLGRRACTALLLSLSVRFIRSFYEKVYLYSYIFSEEFNIESIRPTGVIAVIIAVDWTNENRFTVSVSVSVNGRDAKDEISLPPHLPIHNAFVMQLASLGRRSLSSIMHSNLYLWSVVASRIGVLIMDAAINLSSGSAVPCRRTRNACITR